MHPKYSDKIVIAFNGGAYGSYLMWILYTLLYDDEIFDPFNEDLGNSHKFYNEHKKETVTDITQSIFDSKQLYIPEKSKIITLHPKICFTQSIQRSLDQVTEIFGKYILIYPDKNAYLLNIHNFLTKIWGDIHTSLLQYIELNDVYAGYPDAMETDFKDLPNWILREYMSFNVFSSWEDQVEWYFPDKYENKNMCFITINDILYDVENTIEKIRKEYDLSWSKPVNSILPYHKKNLTLQKYINQDKLSNDILKNFFNNKNASWNPDDITIISESYIQKRLRDSGYELKCHDLNVFPNSISNLKKIIV